MLKKLKFNRVLRQEPSIAMGNVFMVVCRHTKALCNELGEMAHDKCKMCNLKKTHT